MKVKIKSVKRRNPCQDRSRQMVEWIIEASMRLFSEQGYTATTTNKIAELAGVSVGSLYHYFPNKDAILLELGIRHRKNMYRVIIKTLKNDSGFNLRYVLKEIIAKIIHLHRDNLLFIEALTLHTHIDKLLDSMDHDYDLKFWSTVGNIIKRKYLQPGMDVSLESLRQTWIVLGKTGKDVIHNIAMENSFGPDEKIIDGLVDAILTYMYKQPAAP
jgi:AcrR family transcriptional regulator